MTTKVVDAASGIYGSYVVHGTQGGSWLNRTASGIVSNAPCMLIGFYVNQTTAGTLQLFDNASAAANPTGGIITPALGLQWYPAILLNGLFVNIAGTLLDVTFFYLK